MAQAEFHEKLGKRGSSKGGGFNRESGTFETKFQTGEDSWQGKAKSAPSKQKEE